MKVKLTHRVLAKLPHAALVLAILCLLTILCFLFPEILTTPEVRRSLPIPLIRQLLQATILTSIFLALVGYLTSKKAKLCFFALLLQIIVLFLGGADVPVKDEFTDARIQLGLDWFVLDIFLLALIFIPLEGIFPLNRLQKIMRPEIKVDLTYFAVGHLGIQLLAVLTQKPAQVWFQSLGAIPWAMTIQKLPIVLQILLALFISDFIQYWLHRAFHETKLWEFHKIHHSIKTLDWLAGSRLHLVDILIVRTVVYFSILLVGLQSEAFWGYLTVMAMQTVLIHSNLGLNFGPLEHLFATPRYHHWHHHDRPVAYNKNYAVHFPVIDRFFGTQYLPKNEWPTAYGIDEKNYPASYGGQFIYPFRRLLLRLRKR
ncbi:MAG: sterol desaturase family protein [Bacteriovoracia bacterium]